MEQDFHLIGIFRSTIHAFFGLFLWHPQLNYGIKLDDKLDDLHPQGKSQTNGLRSWIYRWINNNIIKIQGVHNA